VTNAIVNIQNLAKTYPGKPPVEAVKGIDLSVERGELFGLLGPNGAGKSTTISVCTTRSLPTGGRVTIAGVDVVAHPSEARRYMGRRHPVQHSRPAVHRLGEPVLPLPLLRDCARRVGQVVVAQTLPDPQT
jgi:ABC-type Na+ transport system ATPase subunit NatA